MKTTIKYRTLVTAVTLGIAVLISSCAKEEFPPEPQPQEMEFKINEDEVNIESEGGVSQVTYSIVNPSEGMTLVWESDAVWVNNEDLSEDGIIRFNVDANNETVERKATVKVAYGEISDSFEIIQEPYVNNEPPAFEIVIPEDKLTATSFLYRIIPYDKEMTYVNMTMLKSAFDEFESTEEIINTDIEYFMLFSEQLGMSLDEFLTQSVLLKGDYENKIQVPPGQPCVVYVYGLNTKAETLTEFYYEIVETTYNETKDMTFDFNYKVDGPNVLAEVTPSDNSQRYVFDVIRKSDYIDDSELKSDYQMYIMRLAANYTMNGMSLEEFLNQITRTGKANFELELPGNTDYVGFAVGIDDELLFVSDVSSKEFRTGEVEPSDNKIEVQIDNIAVTSAEIKVSTSNDDPYVVLLDQKSNWEGMSDSEIQIKLFATVNLTQMVRRGNFETKVTDLEPNGEYVVFTFGYHVGTITTDFIKTEFKTLKPVQSDVTFRLIHDKYFNGDEVMEQYPDFKGAAGLAILPVKAEAYPSERVSGYYYHILKGDLTDPAVTSDEQIFSMLLKNGRTRESEYYFLPFDDKGTIVGFAVDNEGKYGPLYRELISLTKDGVSPVSEFPAPETFTSSLSSKLISKNLPKISVAVEDAVSQKNDEQIYYINN